MRTEGFQINGEIKFPVTICVLCYGPYEFLARRCLGAIERHTDPSLFRLRIGLNATCDATRSLVKELRKRIPDTVVHDSAVNLFKVPMMHRLLNSPPVETKWLIWFDDDSHVTRPDWLPSLAAKMEASPEIAMWGKLYSIQVSAETASFARAAGWFRGLPLVPSGVKPGDYQCSFATGGFWAIRTECLRSLNWPDPRLVHYHNDFMLGEAMRQNGFNLGSFHHGVRINEAARRSPQNVPAGP
jgi:GT2 family glycosyltransferase